MAGNNSLDTWDFNNFHVQVDIKSGEFISAFSVLLAAGPPRLRDTSAIELAGKPVADGQSITAVPIGVVENFSMSQNRQLQRLFEIGSKRSYFIPGRNVSSLQLSRTLFHGPSLLRALYAYAPAAKLGGRAVQILSGAAGEATPDFPDIRNSAGVADYFINLDSDLFDQPFGLYVLLRDSKNRAYGATYLEDCHLQAHQFSINSSSILVAEAINAQFDQAIPVDTGAEPTATKGVRIIETGSERA